MNYLAAREIVSDDGPTGKYHYTSMRDDIVRPIGYCAGWQPWMDGPVEGLHVPEKILEQERLKLAPFKGKFHSHGHENPEEACGCYREFILDTKVRFDHTLSDEQRKCRVCGEWTQSLASIDSFVFIPLCKAHLNRDSVAKYVNVGESVQS